MKSLIILVFFVTMAFSTQTVTIGILAFRSKTDTLQEWNHLRLFLNQAEPEYSFEILPLTYPEMNDAVRKGKIDFVITNPGHYIYLEKKYHISRVATMIRFRNGRWIDSFGGVVFTRSDRADLQTLNDIVGKTVFSVDSESLGGYSAQMYELLHHDIKHDDIDLHFTGMPHSKVVEAVVSNKADVGFVRSDVLEDLNAKGKLDLKEIKILHPQKIEGFPYVVSTTLYPEWPIAQLTHTKKDLSNEVVISLLSRIIHHVPEEGEIGWTAPMEYRDVHEMHQILRIPPYDHPEAFTLQDIYDRYTIFIWIITLLAGLIGIGIVIEIMLRRRLAYESRKNEAFLTFSADGVHILDSAGDVVQVSDSFCSMLGYSRDEMIGMNVTVWDMNASRQEIVENIRVLSGEGETIFSKHRRKDGVIYDAEISVSAIDFNNKRWIYCAARDITNKLLQEAQTQLAALVYEHSSDPIVITDEESNIISVNPAFITMSGYALEEIEGKKTNILNSGHHSEEFYRHLWEALGTHGEWSGEIFDRTKEGNIFSKWLMIRTVYDTQNNPYRRIAIFSDITDQKEAKQQLWYQANFDTLTGLSNRSMFLYRLEKELEQSQRQGLPLVLMYLDLDNFKEINDTLGHEYGDLLLREAAQRLMECVRQNDLVSRLGGDEFTVIFYNIVSLQNIDLIATKILTQFAQPFVIGAENLFVSVSIGITVAPIDGDRADILLKNADQAMYTAKKEGRNRYRYFTASMQDTLQHRTHLIQEMRHAISQNQFVVYYQPIMDLANGLVYKAEALVRWIKSDGTVVNPADFIPIAEETGMINEIGYKVFEQAVAQAAQWRETLHPNFQISVNKSPVQFRSDGCQYSNLMHLIEEAHLKNDAFIVEITEGILMEQTPTVQNKLLEFQTKGLAIALDDFGTGYSSLSYLKKFKIDYLKIDRAFIQNVDTDPNDQVLCEAIVAMAQKLHIKVIAEGVEKETQKHYLESIGCDYIQGYLLSKPVPAEEFERLYRS